MESVVDPPVTPMIKRPPCLGVAALAVPLSKAGDTAAISPKADTRAINSRREILPSDNNRCSCSIFGMVALLLEKLLAIIFSCLQQVLLRHGAAG
jgi:hypothetical protein